MNNQEQHDYLKREKLIDIFSSYPDQISKENVLTILNAAKTDLRWPFTQFKVPSKSVYLRCDDGSEVVVFTRHDWNAHETDYEITIEDSYCNGGYSGIWGRIKRAWCALTGKQVSYTGVFCEGRERMEKFINSCVELMNKERIEVEE